MRVGITGAAGFIGSHRAEAMTAGIPNVVAEAILRLARDPELREQLATAGEATVASRSNGDVLAAGMAGLLGAGAP